ncbi:MAG: transport acessory protein MmpS [Mycobacterium sp.]|nr:transport acessory protein MmpS [Mycobacterium sp.]
MTSFVRRRWIILVTAVVVALTGFAVLRLHDAFRSHKNASRGGGVSNEIVPFNPKQVVYEVFGTPGSTATINYQDVHAAPQRIDNAKLPWSYTITTTDPAVIANVIAQGNG